MTYSSAAITAYKTSIAHNAIKMMFDEKGGWEGDAATGFNHNAMVPYPSLSGRTLPPVSGPTGIVQFFVPGASMNAHGQWDRDDGDSISASGFPPGSSVVREHEIDGLPGYICQVDPWTSCYQPWLERIEQDLEGWDALPDHTRFDAEAKKAGKSLEQLTPSSGFDDADAEEWRPTFADPNRTTAFDLLSEYVGADVDSGMIYAFRKSYGAVKIRTVLGNQGQVALGLTMVLGGETQLWKKAGDDIMTLCEAAKNAFNYQPPDFNFDIDLGVVKAFVDLVGVFVPPPAKVVVGGVSAALGFLQAVIPEDKADPTPPPPLSAGTAEGVATNFEEALKVLRTACFTQEEELYRCAQRLQESIESTPADRLHIHPADGLDPEVAAVAQINVHTDALKDVGHHQVPIIAAIFATAADDLTGLAPHGIWVRGWPLGYGDVGPQKLVADIHESLDQVATGTARELVDAGKKLATAAGWIETSDEETRTLFRGLEDELQRGQTHWESPKPEQPQRPGGI